MAPVSRFVLLAFALTWGIGGIALLVGLWKPELQPLSTSSPLYYLAGYSVSLAGIALTAQYAGREGLRQLGDDPGAVALFAMLVLDCRSGVCGHHGRFVAGHRRDSLDSGDGPAMALVARQPDAGHREGSRPAGRGVRLARIRPPSSARAPLAAPRKHQAWAHPCRVAPAIVLYPRHVANAGVVAALHGRRCRNLDLRYRAVLAHRRESTPRHLVILLANVCGGLALGAQLLNPFLAAEGVAAALVVVVGGLRPIRPLTSPTTASVGVA